MKKVVYFTLFSFALLFSGCAVQYTSDLTTYSNTKEAPVVQNDNADNPNVCNDIVVKDVPVDVSACARIVDNVMYRTPCFGCGDYSVTVRRNNCCVSGGCK
jgi:PBP1b-binding outer membrane lipoprotein LpoB